MELYEMHIILINVIKDPCLQIYERLFSAFARKYVSSAKNEYD